MTNMFAITDTISSGYVIALGLIFFVFVFFVWTIFFQRRQGKELRFELDQLDKMKENDIESEFVIKAMHLATWHLDTRTMLLTFDSDFRDKSSWVVPFKDDSAAGDLERQIFPEDAERVTKALAALCEGRTEEYHTEYRVAIPYTKKYYWEESYATVVERDVDGKPISIVGTTQIVTDRKDMEAALIDARNRAEESDRLKSAFIANISHEIRTPLNAIIGFTSVLPDITSDDERKALLDLIHENTQKLLRIIDDVVNISKIESGQEKMMAMEFDLNLMLVENVERYRLDLKPGVEMNTNFAAETQLITTDLNRFNEVVKHLLSNATKFTEKGSIEVGYAAPKNGRIKIWVRDTGKGISEENREKVFERFFKVDEFIPGAGLGLSICRTMAESVGGTVSVESRLGEGSTFIFELPIK